eukprot:8071815-Pyramimonas_sp.AAC.1
MCHHTVVLIPYLNTVRRQSVVRSDDGLTSDVRQMRHPRIYRFDDTVVTGNVVLGMATSAF